MNKWLSWKESGEEGRHYLNLNHVVRLQLIGKRTYVVTTHKETFKIEEAVVLDEEDIERAIKFYLD